MHLGGWRLLEVRALFAPRRAVQLGGWRRILLGRGLVAVWGAVGVGQHRLLLERALVVQIKHESCRGKGVSRKRRLDDNAGASMRCAGRGGLGTRGSLGSSGR